MTALAESIRLHHEELRPHVAFIRVAANAVGHASTEDLREDLDEVIGFLTHVLIPHAAIEDRIVYPAVDRLVASATATRSLRREHEEVARLTEQLRELRPYAYRAHTDPPVACEFRRLLYGLDAVIGLHLAKEEEQIIPLLEERLTASEADELAQTIAEVGAVPLPD